jgi:hypothetical protein
MEPESPVAKNTTAVLLDAVKNERIFLFGVVIAFIIVGLVTGNLEMSMWLGFMLAGYSTIANDSIQTIGTFLASNHKRPWWLLWLYIGGVFVITMFMSWYLYDGDVSYQRLTSKGFETAPTELSYLQVAAPLFLLIVTRIRMPVSTTFMILSCFSTTSSAIHSVLLKSVSGYVVALVASMIVWGIFARKFDRWFTGEAHGSWILAQWVSTTVLWVVWLMQDAANIAVYLPRQLNLPEFLFFVLFIFLGLGILFYLRGDRIQDVVNEKSKITDIRGATIIDFVYAIILFVFQFMSSIPMSTTWVFIGLLGGRELAMTLNQTGHKTLHGALKMMGRDLMFAGIGLTISITLAVAINPKIKQEFFQMIGF